MTPDDLRHALNTSLLTRFLLHPVGWAEPIEFGWSDDWIMSPSGRYFIFLYRDGIVYRIKAEEIQSIKRVERRS